MSHMYTETPGAFAFRLEHRRTGCMRRSDTPCLHDLIFPLRMMVLQQLRLRNSMDDTLGAPCALLRLGMRYMAETLDATPPNADNSNTFSTSISVPARKLRQKITRPPVLGFANGAILFYFRFFGGIGLARKMPLMPWCS